MVEINYDKKYKNTDKFRQAAIRFKKYGYYTTAPKGTTEARKYWDEEIKRSIEGFTADDGDFISGYNYFYLNYSPITLNTDRWIIRANGSKRKVTLREQEHPEFWDSDKQFFDMVQEAEEQGTHLVTLKARGKGYSFKTASMLCRNYFLIRESKSYGIASEKEFLVKDGLLSKTWDMMDHIDEHTAWTKKRTKTNSLMHRKSSYVESKDGTPVEMGYKSEIIGVTLKNDVQKARGKRGKLILWEEAGKFPGLLEAWQIAQPSVEHTDGTAFGLMIAFGTGGTDDGDFGSLKELFYKPQAYNALEIRNIWDTGASATSCGFFVPQYVNMGKEFTDDQGNSLIVEAKKNAVISRKKVEDNSNDKNAIDRYIAERPFTPMEATLQLAGNIFPKKELSEQLARIQVDQKLSNYKQVGELMFDENGKVKWIQTKGNRDILKYPLDKEDSKRGAVVIWEHPPVDDIPYGLYIGGCDPYDHDDSGTGSLGSTFIYKRFQGFESYYDVIVAEYTGRPDTADEYYENVRTLLLYYNATLLYENERKGIFPYFTGKSCDYLLADQPDVIGDIVRKSTVSRKKGVHMVTSIKDWGERELRDWLNEEISPGVKQLTRIMSVPLLQELISYNSEGNFDRVMAMMMVMIYKKELHKVHIKEKTNHSKSDPFLTGPLFARERTLNFNIR